MYITKFWGTKQLFGICVLQIRFYKHVKILGTPSRAPLYDNMLYNINISWRCLMRLVCLPDESDGPWKGSSFCLLAFGGPSTKWSAIVNLLQTLLFTKPKPKHWPNATADRSHCTVIHYLLCFIHNAHSLYSKL